MRSLWLALTLGVSSPVWGFPHVCDVVNTPNFKTEVALSVSYSWCPSPFPLPPWPCSHVSYNLPKYFVEVVNRPGQTMFESLPGVAIQMAGNQSPIPFAAEDDAGSYSYHAHVLNIPFTQWAFSGMACGGGLPDLFCFSAASEHLGSNWKTGLADMWHPQFKLWSLKPKACLTKGALMSATGSWGLTGGGIESMCSNELVGRLPKYPPTDAPVCTGWGIHFPRTGTVTSSDQTTASLVIASRIKSIGGDVFRSVSSSATDKWQMIYPQTSGCFREGQNIAYLRRQWVNETGRLMGKLNKFLYAIWQRRSCTVDWATGTASKVWLSGVIAACRGIR